MRELKYFNVSLLIALSNEADRGRRCFFIQARKVRQSVLGNKVRYYYMLGSVLGGCGWGVNFLF